MMDGMGCGVCALLLLYRYVSGYKNRYQNFIRYLRELGDEVSNRFCWRCALKALQVSSCHWDHHVHQKEACGISKLSLWNLRKPCLGLFRNPRKQNLSSLANGKELLDKISCTCLLQSIIHAFFSGFAGTGCHYTCRCACRVLRCQGDWFLEVGHLEHRIVIIWCLSFILAWSL